MLSSRELVAVNFLIALFIAAVLPSEGQDENTYPIQHGEHCKINHFEHQELHLGETKTFCKRCEDGYENLYPELAKSCSKIKDTSDGENDKASDSLFTPTNAAAPEQTGNNTQGYSSQSHNTTANSTVPERNGNSTQADIMPSNYTTVNDTAPGQTGISTHASLVPPHAPINGYESQDENSGGAHTFLIVLLCIILVLAIFAIWLYCYLKKFEYMAVPL